MTAVADLTIAFRRVVPDLTEEAARDLVAAVIALTATLWQNAHPGPTLARLYERDPALAHARFEFAPRLTTMLNGFVVGLRQTAGA